jgi:hypothetical protein
MTHVVVWIDHKEARIFRVHPEAAGESRVLSPQHPVSAVRVPLPSPPESRRTARDRRRRATG